MIARLSRIIPLIIILAIVAAIVYLVATWRYSPNKAKEILIRVFTWFTGILSAALALICVYVLLDGNWAVFELTAGFLATALIALGITGICRAVFVHHHPNYKKKAQRPSASKGRTENAVGRGGLHPLRAGKTKRARRAAGPVLSPWRRSGDSRILRRDPHPSSQARSGETLKRATGAFS